ncbi:hypothetical protein MalM25_33070 [Planctomycetes bacterium MalM25]|nr:hypothetical protein MalM25_33070 [Planctomycetes bacterium MalM25]
MPTCHEILSSVINRAGLKSADGSPLYAYRVTEHEIEQIRIELRNRLTLAGRLRTSSEHAAFCLFASEWFRIEHQRGPWEWVTILNGIGGDPSVWTRSDLCDYTLSGLAWWNLAVINTGSSRRFLATLVCQGGFPVNTLRNDGASLSRLLKQSLQEHEQFPEESVDRIIEQHRTRLPETLRTPGFLHLLARTVEAVAKIRKDCTEAAQQQVSRRDWLDENSRDWHHQLPFRLEDQEGQAVLLSLLDSPEPIAVDRQLLAVITGLTEGEQGYYLERRLQFPPRINAARFRSLCGLEPGAPLFPRMTGFLRAGSKHAAVCKFTQPYTASSEDPELSLSPAGSARIVPVSTEHPTRLEVRSGTEHVLDAILPGGDMLPDSPWVFREDAPQSLIGVGSVSTRQPSVLVASPESALIDAERADELPSQIEGRRLFRIQGSAQIEHDDTTYCVRTGHSDSTEFLYELRGRRWCSGTGGSEAWLDVPEVFELRLDATDQSRKLTREEVRWRPIRGGDWQRMGSDCVGNVILRASVAGETKLQTRATILPPDFRLETRPGRDQHRGRWTFRNIGTCGFSLADSPGVSARATASGDDLVVDVTLDGERPDRIATRLSFPNDCVATLVLVTPTVSCQLITVAGTSIDAKRGIAIEQFDGLWIRVVRPDGKRPLLIDVANDVVIDAFREASDGVWEYPLSRAKERATGLLAETDDRDCLIRLSVAIGNTHDRVMELRIGRYGYKLQPAAADQTDQERVRLQDTDLVDALADDPARMGVIALNDPEIVLPPHCVAEESPGVWRIDLADAEPGYYLVTGRTASGDLLRPLRITAGELPDAPPEKSQADYSFDEVSTIREERKRREVWDTFYTRVTEDFGAPDWAKVDAVTEASIELPITTYEAVTGLIRNPIAAARVGLLNPSDAALWGRLEELPFLWCLVPIEAWVRATARLMRHRHTQFEQAGLSAELANQHAGLPIANFVDCAWHHHPSAGVVSACLFTAGLVDKPPTQLRLSSTDSDYSVGFNALVSRHERFDSRQTWPSERPKYGSEARGLLEGTPGLLNTYRYSHEWAVINGPSLAAIHAVYGIPINPSQLTRYQRLRSFDATWFDYAFQLAMIRLIGRRSDEQPDWLEAIATDESA